MTRSWITVAWTVISLFAAPSASATMLDPNFTESTFLPATLPRITGMAWAPDGSHRLFLTLKDGPVRVVENGVLLSTPFADISPVFTNNECGVVGIAFDPGFVQNRYVYFFVTVSASEQQIIRYTDGGNVGTDKTTIVPALPTAGQNHDGGAVGIGPDGKLYWAIGDLGNGTGVDANLTSLAAKIGRANPDGTVLNDNPFFDGAGTNDDRIWARGFRNPFTFTWQPSTERLWVNVVGTNYEQVFLPVAGDHVGYNDYENNQPPGFLAPVIAYRTNGTDMFNVAAGGAVRSGGIATFTTTAAHNFRLGGKITVANVSDTSFNTAGYVTAVPSPTEFSIAQNGPDATSGGGTATTVPYGGCITGGAFWDSSAVGASYRGNFFFGDLNAGRIHRVTLGANNEVTSVDYWAEAFPSPIDISVGPDGALYYVNHAGLVRRAAYNFASQALIVSPLHVRVPEGASGAFFVRLALAPAGDVDVALSRSGDADVSVTAGASLRFDATNWSTPQVVRFAAAGDTDSIDDLATLTVSSQGLAPEDVTVRVTDDDPLSLLVSTTTATLAEGGSSAFDVTLSGPPIGTVIVSVTRSAGDSDVLVTGGTELTFSASNWFTPQTVTLTALGDADATGDAATVTLSASGLAPRDVSVAVIDDESSAPLITSSPVTTAVVGAPYSYDVEATGLPVPSFSLDAAPSGMSIDSASGLIVWTPAAVGDATVTVRVANTIAPDATQSFTISVADDQAPTCRLTAPQPGQVLTGTIAEFFGDVLDDVGATHAEFSVDGVVAYDDVGTSGHYHYGGTHNQLDTTLLADGVHTFRLTGYDTSGQTCSVEVQASVDNVPSPDAGSGATGPDGGDTPTDGGPNAADGAPDSGVIGVAGSSGSGGASPGGAGTSGTAGTGGGIATPASDASTASPADSSDDGGCGCRLNAKPARSGALWLVALGALLERLRRSRLRSPPCGRTDRRRR